MPKELKNLYLEGMDVSKEKVKFGECLTRRLAHEVWEAQKGRYLNGNNNKERTQHGYN